MGPLRARIAAVARRARVQGRLEPIPTRTENIRDGGAEFRVRVMQSLERKARAAQAPGAVANPFQPHDPALYVGPAGPRHLLLLNKYPALDGHVLVVTRRYAPQASALTADDFTALWRCLARCDALAFYNAGAVAGASQGHKHLQLVCSADAPAAFLPQPLPFRHAAAALDPGWRAHPPRAGRRTADLYERLLTAAGQAGPGRYADYNLLVTRRAMLVVPRSAERCEEVSVNALGFAGLLLVRDDAALARVRQRGPMAVLRAVAAA